MGLHCCGLTLLLVHTVVGSYCCWFILLLVHTVVGSHCYGITLLWAHTIVGSHCCGMTATTGLDLTVWLHIPQFSDEPISQFLLKRLQTISLQKLGQIIEEL